MQPEFSKLSKSLNSKQHVDPTKPTNQHGIPRDSSGSPSSPGGGHRQPAGDTITTDEGGDGEGDGDGDNDNGNESEKCEGEGRRLRSVSPIAGSIIDEYERNSRASSPGSKVVSPARPLPLLTLTAASPISGLPNEMLTHALSHLTPQDLSSVSLVSHRFHSLVTTPHAWRAAFARFFPGSTSLNNSSTTLTEAKAETFRSDKRVFCRLTALATWRSEYILRTRLIRSLARGKPLQSQSASSASSTPRGATSSANAIMMYNSQLFTPVLHLDATFGSGPHKLFPRFIHGADGHATSSDPLTGKVDNWGLTDPQMFLSFDDHFFGETMYGLGAGEIVGLPNVMDVSQAYGMACGEGAPNGAVYFRSVDEMRGRFLAAPVGIAEPELGIPRIDRTKEAVSAVWIAKSSAIASLTEGLVGIMSGSTLGVLSSYSLGSNDLRDRRLGRGELTARWILSPGVPIIALAVDESYSLKRQAQNRVWAVALNALGELFCLTKFPKRAALSRGTKLDEAALEMLAWGTGRTVSWNLVELSRRTAKPDPYGDADIDGSYSPRSSWNGMCLDKEQIKAESREIETFLRKLPKDFRKLSLGWDMRRRLEVDFAGDDGNFAGESMMVIQCGLDEDGFASVRRFTRLKVCEDDASVVSDSFPPTPDDNTPMVEHDSIFGMSSPLERGRGHAPMEYSSMEASPERAPTIEEWRCTRFSFGSAKAVQITATTIDCSMYAMLTLSEDPAVGGLGSSNSSRSSNYGSPFHAEDRSIIPSDIPGQRARFVAAGTKTGQIFVWDCRAPASKAVDMINTVEPVRMIYTDSPEISCLGMTALQLVHGGNDGLVQAWDVLASGSEPIRTLNSRFSSKARRRLVQAQTSQQGVGINMFAAGALCLDPDPTVLRGMVSLGTHLRYWSYSSQTADQYKGGKRRLRHSDRGSNNHGGERFSGAVRNAGLKAYIMNERVELDRENKRREKERERLAGRFGLGLELNEEEAVAYAAMLSEESLAADEVRRSSASSTPAMASRSSTTAAVAEVGDEDVDADLAAAIRLSLESSEAERFDTPHYTSSPSSRSTRYDVPIRFSAKKGKKSSQSSSRSPPSLALRSPSSIVMSPLGGAGGSSKGGELEDLEFALQLSLAEEESRKMDSGERVGDEFPTLSGEGKGKGRA
ncbi:hypothetical protein EJ08DRAFT_122967 [Tothia fuscella]|uniref:F-box domain-containing protein n=1 Tax=Tothia fuscella TaxID=1048955 RepID=A0A9P4NWC6_9PEZI|nr:hypothetical protein EJ08DRAFT_122967 [Tothia fuscella]